MQLPRAELPGRERGLQQIPALGQIGEDRARLVLPAPSAHRGADDADERGWMKRALQERHVAKRLPDPRGVGVALRAAALMGQQDDRKVRPRRLIVEPVHEAAQIRGLDRLVGDHGKTRAVFDFAQQRRQIDAGMRVIARLPDQGCSDRRVAALRRENDGPLG